MAELQSAIGKTYAEIWAAFSAKHGSTADMRKLHIKWKQLAAEVK